MDCNHARLPLSFTHKKAELDSAEAEALQAHLEQCPECEQTARCESSLDKTLGRAMRTVAVPAGLKARLLDGVASHSRVRVRRAAAWTAVAAALILTALGFAWYAHRPRVNWDRIQTEIAERNDVTETAVSQPLTAPEQIEAWFARQGVRMEAPRQFNYASLKSLDIARRMDRDVPKLVFARDEGGQLAMAEVYVLSEGQLNLDELKRELKEEKLGMPGSQFNLQVMQSPGSGSVFLVIYQGRLEAFSNPPDA